MTKKMLAIKKYRIIISYNNKLIFKYLHQKNKI